MKLGNFSADAWRTKKARPAVSQVSPAVSGPLRWACAVERIDLEE
jgi:hypothetical protein